MQARQITGLDKGLIHLGEGGEVDVGQTLEDSRRVEQV